MQESQKAQKSKKKNKSRAAAHDAAYPREYIDYMMEDWAPRKQLVKTIPAAKSHRSRRNVLSKMFVGLDLVIPTGHEVFRNNDANFRFRPHSSFFYLTGNTEADCVLVMEATAKKHRHVLYVEANPGRSEATFFMDRHKGELWVGPRLGVKESMQKFAVDETRPLSDLKSALKKIKKRGNYAALRGVSPLIDEELDGKKKNAMAMARALGDMRLLKDDSELRSLKKVGDATRRGFEDIIRCLPRAKTEREVETALYARARIEGNDVGYNVIAAAGANACILHWNDNNGPIKKGDLLLVDAGIEGHDFYTADVTRSLPINGKFSATQREVYTWVLKAQEAAIRAVKPGAEFLAPHRAAAKVLAKGLVEMGILKMSVDEALSSKAQPYRRYTLHGTSHMLGLDVHDCSDATPERYRNGKLVAGMVLTVEPGLYFQPDDLKVPKKYRGIGIRIEDDIAVTASGRRILTQIPRKADDVEAWMASVWGEKRK